ncbi:hypothetical protein [uncultured Jatrophihabitans sp.]|uniref:hypothetical protein n=1 Tax=uncultured Jatrophihabitans sp. TaxID=1610747 RepID=UPI0035CA5197
MTATTQNYSGTGDHALVREQAPKSTETKAAFKTTEFIAYLGAVIAVIVTALVIRHTSGHNDYFRADRAIFYIVLLTIGYLGSRGLAKSGSHESRNH